MPTTGHNSLDDFCNTVVVVLFVKSIIGLSLVGLELHTSMKQFKVAITSLEVI